MSEVEQRLADLLHARAEQVKVTFVLDDVKRAGSVDLVVPERREQPLDRQGRVDTVAEFGATEYPDDDRVRARPRRRWMLVAAATIGVLALGWRWTPSTSATASEPTRPHRHRRPTRHRWWRDR